MPRALKVYRTRLGFFETVVAASSQKAALQAWSVHQDLFANGEAEVTTDPDIVRAARAHPGQPLKRPVGSHDAFALDATPQAPSGLRAGKRKRDAPKPDRAKLDAAEARLQRIEDAQARGEANFFDRREALEAEAADARKRWAADAKAARAEVQRARRAFAKAGGHA
jgi:hypothetical protein